MAIALVRARELTSLQTDYQQLVEKSPGYSELIGESPPMRELKAKITRVAKAPGCVLVRGESGSGKELVARAIHRASPRADRPMVSVNCAAIPADIMESQLFGHKAGAFTGADRDHIGYFEQADLGTLFLDEVGEMTLEGQAKLLRILEGHPFLPVGATKEVKVDVRLIAATNQDLQTVRTREAFSGGSVLPAERVRAVSAAAAGSRRATSGCWSIFSSIISGEQHGRPTLAADRGGAGEAARVPLAGQRAAAAQCAR